MHASLHGPGVHAGLHTQTLTHPAACIRMLPSSVAHLGSFAGEGGVAERIEVACRVLSNRQVTRAPRARVDKSHAVMARDELALHVREREHHHLRADYMTINKNGTINNIDDAMHAK